MGEAPRWPVLALVRIPIGARLRVFADVLASMEKVAKGAPTMRQRRQFRLAMEKRKRARLRLWRGNMR
jgi:hypothetical protein